MTLARTAIQMITTSMMTTKAKVLILASLLASYAQADIYSYKYFFGEEMSARVACDRALDETKRMAISAQLGEIVQSSTFQQCFDDSSLESDCHTHTDIYVAGKLGYIKSASLVEKRVVLLETGQACAVKAQIEVVQYKGEPDPRFQVDADILPSPILRSGEFLEVQLGSPNEAQITIYAGSSGGRFDLLETRYWGANSGAVLKLPDQRSESLWRLENEGVGRSFEKLWVIATKARFELPQTTTESELFARLGRLPRSDWDSLPLGYQILPRTLN